MASVSVRIRDFSDEYSTVSFPVDDIAAAGSISDANTLVDNFVAAIDPLVLGTVVVGSLSQAFFEGADARPASGEAQREKGLRIYWTNGAGRYGSVTLPTADFGTLAQPGTDLIDLADIASLVTLIEANITLEGLPVTVERAILVGRAS